MPADISNRSLRKKKIKPAHSSPPDYGTMNVVPASDVVSCAENDEEMIFLPVCLANDIAEYLMDNKTQNTSLKCKMLQPAKIRKDADLCEARQKYFKEHAAFFKDSSFEDYPVERYAGMITNIASDWIYENLPKFYIDGDEEDEDVARWGKEKVKPMIAVESPDGDDIAVLYFNPNKIQGSGSYESMKLLEDLVKEKHLTQDDVLTVLNAVKLTN